MLKHMRTRLEQSMRAVRPPTPRGVIREGLPAYREPLLTIAFGRGPDDATASLSGVIERPDPPRLIIPDPRTDSTPDAALIASLLAWAQPHGSTLLGIAPDTPASTAQRWRTVAAMTRTRVVVLGADGYNRHSNAAPGTILPYIDMPTEIAQARTIIVVSAPTGGRSCSDIWKHIVHPNTALRAASAGVDGVMELGHSVNACYVVGIRAGSRSGVVWATNELEADLVALAAHRIHEQYSGTEAEGPWEDARVQRLVALQIERPKISDLVLRELQSDSAANAWVGALAEQIGGRVERIPAGGRDE